MAKPQGKYFVCLFFLLIPTLIFGSHKIILLHCYFCPKMVMDKIERSCIKEHFVTENYAYKSITENLDTLGMELYLDIKKSEIDTISFVTHSMGALVVRSMLRYSQEDENFPLVYRIVMIAPPNHGSEMADFGSSIGFLKDIAGPNMSLMKTDSSSYTNKLPIPTHTEIGIIIGGLGKKHGYNPFIKGDNDGLVTPDEARLGIERDFALVRGFHGLLPLKKKVREQVIEFLKSGRFLMIKNRKS